MRSIMPIFVMILAYSSGSEANFKKLGQEFMEKNFRVNSNQQNLESTRLNEDIIIEEKSWDLSISSQYRDSELDSPSPFVSLSEKTWNSAVEVDKSNFYGGNFFLDTEYDLTKDNPTFQQDSLFEFGQSIGYTQSLGKNFLGRQDQLELSISKAETFEFDQKIQKENEASLISFYRDYLTAKKKKSDYIFAEQTLKRAVARLKEIKKQYDDGLKDQVDVLQSEIQKIESIERLRNIDKDLARLLQDLSDALHRKVQSSEIESYTRAQLKKLPIPKGNIENNKEILEIRSNLKTTNLEVEFLENDINPSVDLTAEIESNEYDSSETEVFKKGNLFGDNRAYVVGVSLSFPIGFEVESLNKTKKNIEKNIYLMELSKLSKSLMAKEQFLKQRIELLESNISSATKKLEFAKRSLSAYEKRYERGQSGIFDIINAEDILINAEQTLTSYVNEKEIIISELLEVYGLGDSLLDVESL